MYRRILFISLLVSALLASVATAEQKSFEMPQDMKSLLPASADAVLAVSSLEELDALWREVLPHTLDRQDASLSHYLQLLDPAFVEHVDRSKPFLAVLNLMPPMGGEPYQVTGLMALKDNNFEVASVPGLDKFNLIREGQYLAVSTDPYFSPSDLQPAWASELNAGLMSVTLDLTSIIDTYRFLLEMGLSQMQLQAENSSEELPSLETTLATIKLARSFLNSAEGLDLFLSQDGDLVTKDFIFRTQPGSDFAPGPQPSFTEALQLTRFLPGGESLLTVSALDQSSQMNIFMDYYLATMHSTTALMPPEAARLYETWYTDYLNTMTISFAPSAMTMRFEKNNSSFQSIIKSDDAPNDWRKLLDLANRMNGFGMGLEMAVMEAIPFKGHDVSAWQLVPNEEELNNLATADLDLSLDDPLVASNMVTMLRFLSGNIYLAQVDNYLLFCGGPTQGLMNELIGRVDENKGQVDPRLKKVNKNGFVQSATVGDLNAALGVVLELVEEMTQGDEIPWITNHPLPFKQTLAIDHDDYLVHVEMKKSVVQELIKSALDLEQD